MSEQVNGEQVAAKLGIVVDALNSMFTNVPVGGYDGTQVAALLRSRYGIEPFEALGEELARQGILTPEEGAWLDDQD